MFLDVAGQDVQGLDEQRFVFDAVEDFGAVEGLAEDAAVGSGLGCVCVCVCVCIRINE